MGATYHRLMIQSLASLLVVSGGTPALVAQQRSPSQSESHPPMTAPRQTTPVTRLATERLPAAQQIPPADPSQATRRPLAKRNDSSPVGSTRDSTTSGVWTVAGSLALVLGVLAVFLWISRRAGWANSQSLPDQAIRVLGSTPLDPRHQLRLVRIGNRVVALAVSATSVQSIAEIREPEEVARLTALCNDGTGPAITELVNTNYDQPNRIPRNPVHWDATATSTKQQRDGSPVRG